MEFSELILKRESCRDYKTDKVSRGELIKMIEAARLAPSACNSQPWRFVAVDEEDKVGKMAEYVHKKETGENAFSHSVPAYIVILETKAVLADFVDKKQDSQRHAQLDVGLATAFLTLAAADEGLSTCIMGTFDEERVRELLDIPEKDKIRLVVAVGHAKKPDVRTKKRKKLEEILSFNKF